MSFEAFDNYLNARTDAQRQANVYQRPMGLEKAIEFGRIVFRVKMLPKNPDQRFGWELWCEVIEPEAR